MQPSELGCGKQSIPNHLRTALVAPVHNLVEEDEKYGAGYFHVSGEADIIG
ncbi:hypothetical protein I79_000847 [Cricetulus griseus]|uniref:Uncharacterized protein n=1 Tax=Cricetulus griseus TaxID=10029 RepID=G3GT73_CRIGR|nr:hypothetical protein I79_000847 [Cricetulus griseus]